MNEFLDKLSGALGSMSAAQKKEILADYREHFEAGLADGKSEAEIARALGDRPHVPGGLRGGARKELYGLP
jgi:uncharacterized membrane protein